MKGFKKTKLAVAISISMCAGLALAEEETTPAAEDDEIVVILGIRDSLAHAVNEKRESSGIIDSISAEDIGDFPDLNVSESLQRITGVTLERTMGEGTRVSVRGLAAEFTQVLINGQTVTSGNDGREVDFDVFASELFTGLSVVKSHSADAIEGGLAGSINLNTARPFEVLSDRDEIYSVSLQGTNNQMAGGTDPRASMLGAVKLMDGKLGLLGSFAYSETALRQDNVEGLRFRATDATFNGETQFIEYPFIPRYVLEFLDRERLGVTGAVQYQASDEMRVNLDIAYAEFDTTRKRHSIDGLVLGQVANPTSLTVDSTGLATQATMDGVTSRSENILTPSSEDLLLINLDSSWSITEDWELFTRVGHSEATKDQLEFRSTWNNDGTFFYDLSDRIFVGIGQVGQDITAAANFDDRHEARFIRSAVEDSETSFQFDAERTIISDFITSVKTGIRFSSREKTKELDDGRIRVTGVSLADYATSFPVNDFMSQYGHDQIIRSWAVPDFGSVMNDTTLIPSGFTPAPKIISYFGVEEESVSGYVQANVVGDMGDVPVRGYFGARVVSTEQTPSGFTSNGDAVSQTKDYSEVLPSIMLSFELSEDLILRSSYAKSLTRPTLTNLTPGGTIANSVNDAKFGNPDLDPYTADNYDLSLEWYFGRESLASIAYFKKDVTGFITNIATPEILGADVLGAADPRAGEMFSVTRPINGDEAFVKGFELSVQHPFENGFGVLANYTYSDSESSISFQDTVLKTLLPGQSESSYNLVGYFENEDFSIRFAYAWRDAYLDEIRTSQTERSNFTDEYGQLDMNMQYNVTDSITVTFDALNLTEAEHIRFGETKDRNISYSETGRFFNVGVRMKF